MIHVRIGFALIVAWLGLAVRRGPRAIAKRTGVVVVTCGVMKRCSSSDARTDAGRVRTEQAVHDRERALVAPHVRAARDAAAELERVEPQDALAARAPAGEVGLQHVVAFEAEALDLFEAQSEHRHEVLRLEQVHVERVLEVGGRVRRDDERGAVGPQDARELADVQHRVHEVLDDVRRHDRVDRRRRARRGARRPCPRSAGADRRVAPRPVSTTVGAL